MAAGAARKLVTWAALEENVRLLTYRIPTAANALTMFNRDEVARNASETRPILHADTKTLIDEFLQHKKSFGNAIEKKVLKDENWSSFITRLLVKRPLVFFCPEDSYLLQNGYQGYGGWELIGTDKEGLGDKSMENLLSYEEIQIAALVSVSVPTHFINSGNRQNAGRPDKPGTFEPHGVYIGVVGTRFEKPGYMEWQHMIVSQRENTPQNGYGAHAPPSERRQLLDIWAKFYDQRKEDGRFYFPAWDEISESDENYKTVAHLTKLNVDVFKRRLAVVLEPFLLDANARASKEKSAYVHVVGLGLGAWLINGAVQGPAMMEVYRHLLNTLSLPHISVVDFSWFADNCQQLEGLRQQQIIKTATNEILINFSQRNPADKLVGAHEGKLLVAMYAWDGNSYPGNEYWLGSLRASGDPAAACCSTIPYLQNPDVNPTRLNGESTVFYP